MTGDPEGLSLATPEDLADATTNRDEQLQRATAPASRASETNCDPTRRMARLRLGKDCKRLRSFGVEPQMSLSMTNIRQNNLFSSLLS
jgi:hypothetical protein